MNYWALKTSNDVYVARTNYKYIEPKCENPCGDTIELYLEHDTDYIFYFRSDSFLGDENFCDKFKINLGGKQLSHDCSDLDSAIEVQLPISYDAPTDTPTSYDKCKNNFCKRGNDCVEYLNTKKDQKCRKQSQRGPVAELSSRICYKQLWTCTNQSRWINVKHNRKKKRSTYNNVKSKGWYKKKNSSNTYKLCKLFPVMSGMKCWN